MYNIKFSYSLEREYPFKWFSWVVIVGGLALAGIFSALNVAVTGYNLEVLYTTDLNSTLTTHHWFDDPPFNILAKSSVKCEPASLQIGQTMYTDKLTLQYTLLSVEIQDLDSQNKTAAPALLYSENSIQNCFLNEIQVYVEGMMDRDALSLARLPWNLRLYGFVTCETSRDTSIDSFNLSVYFDPSITEPLVGVNQITDPSLWWSWALLKHYVVDAISAFERVAGVALDSTLPVKGFQAFYRNNECDDISNGDYFTWNSFTVMNNSHQIYNSPRTVTNWTNSPEIYPNMSVEADAYAKAFYSFIMADLGQNTSTLSTNASILQQYTEMFTPNHNYGSLNTEYANSSYKNLISQGMSPDLFVRPSTFYTQYICQVPRIKSTGTLIASVVLADLVFLSASWTILKWIARFFLRNDAMYCSGCSKLYARNSHRLLPSSTASASGIELLDRERTVSRPVSLTTQKSNTYERIGMDE